jgi:hypothetical protein
MRCLRLRSVNFFSIYQKVSSLSANNNLLKRFLYQLRINFLPTILMLIFSSIIALYFSELIERSRVQSDDFKTGQTSHTLPMNPEAQAFARK